MDLIDLKVDTRTKTGNGPARELRRQGKVPAVLYGRETAPVLLSVGSKALETVFKEGASAQLLLRLDIQGGDGKAPNVMIKELQTHPVSRGFLHVDFYEIDMARKIHVNIPVVTKGTAAGVEDGGILQIIRRELEVMCLPTEIPEFIELDVTAMKIGDSIHVKEIHLPGDVEILSDVNFTVLTVLSRRVDEALGAEGAEREVGEAEIGGGGEADASQDEEA